VVSSAEMRAEAQNDASGGGAGTMENEGPGKSNNEELVVTEKPW
jgi:hypothetical protein